MATPEPNLPSQGRMIGGMALIVIGLLILIPSGLCTAIFGVMSFADLFSSPSAAGEAMSILLEVLIVGGPFIVVGFVLFRVGLALRRKPAPPKIDAF
jgi:hypothetical protein